MASEALSMNMGGLLEQTSWSLFFEPPSPMAVILWLMLVALVWLTRMDLVNARLKMKRKTLKICVFNYRPYLVCKTCNKNPNNPSLFDYFRQGKVVEACLSTTATVVYYPAYRASFAEKQGFECVSQLLEQHVLTSPIRTLLVVCVSGVALADPHPSNQATSPFQDKTLSITASDVCTLD